MDYIKINKEAWNNRTEIHFDSEFYDNKGFIAGKSSLNDIELNLLGDITGKSALHLQCHFGQDTISLARMGASVTGVDLSDKAVDRANELNNLTKSDCSFICCDLYDLPNHLDEKFDIVFTTYGTIGWLPDIDKWASLVSRYLKPGGQFIFVEFHPVVWMFDDDFSHIQYRYFKSSPIVEEQNHTYTNKETEFIHKSISWNHGMGEVVNALIRAGLKIESLDEFDYSPYDCFNKTKKIGDRKFRIEHMDNKLPMVYAIKAVKSI